MLAGLLIATHDADDRPGTLTATLPFGGVTLIEYHARLLVAAGASQIVVMVARLTPELLAAIGRIGRRSIAVDTVRSAAEIAERLHPLARVLMLADGLTTTADVVADMAYEGGDALLVAPEDERGPAYERVGGGMAWAGIARLDPARIAELAALPRDYDPQSTLVRLASQARATHVLLPSDAPKRGHGIDHRDAVLSVRGRGILSAAVSTRRGWFDRLVVAPIARLTMPLLVARSVPLAALFGGAGLCGAIGLGLAWSGHFAIGAWLALLATIALMLTGMLATLRDDDRAARAGATAALLLPALAVLIIGRGDATGNGTAFLLAVALVATAALVERGVGAAPRDYWWGSPAAYLAIIACASIPGQPTGGVAIAAIYAFVTLWVLVERFRKQA